MYNRPERADAGVGGRKRGHGQRPKAEERRGTGENEKTREHYIGKRSSLEPVDLELVPLLSLASAFELIPNCLGCAGGFLENNTIQYPIHICCSRSS